MAKNEHLIGMNSLNNELYDVQQAHLRVCTKYAKICLQSYNAADEKLLADLRSSNTESERLAQGHDSLKAIVKRWNVENDTIPVFDNNDARAEQALDIIELVLGRTIFQRDASKEDIKEQRRGLIFARGTAAPPDKKPVDENCKGSVGADEGSGSFPENFCDPDTGEFQQALYINLDGPSPNGGKADLFITLHELAHALGLEREFDGFGDGGPPISPKMFQVLKLLYELPVGSKPSDNAT
jgi:hypothetical protein